MSIRVITGDCIVQMALMPAESIDSIVTDPPAGIGFMGKGWDSDKGGRDQWIAWMTEVAAQALRVLKPGGHALVWAIPRTSHWTATAWENAGFEVRDRVAHLFGSGFPKSLDVSKAIDAHVTRGRSDSVALCEVNETRPGEATVRTNNRNGHHGFVGSEDVGPSVKRATPASAAAAEWQGWGTALKPAMEDWWLLRKPIQGTVAANVLKHGTGAINVDGCRVDGIAERPGTTPPSDGERGSMAGALPRQEYEPSALGRWPANVLHDGSEEVIAAFPEVKTGAVKPYERNGLPGFDGGWGTTRNFTQAASEGSAARFFYTAKASRHDRNDGAQELMTWEHADLSQLEEALSQLRRGTSGALTLLQDGPAWNITSCGSASAVSFLLAVRCTIATESRRTTGSKTSNPSRHWSTSESIRDAISTARANGSSLAELAEFISRCRAATTCEKTASALDAGHALFVMLSDASKSGRKGNIHSTVKPTDLMRYLCRLVTPPGGTVLDPFAGSGSTLKAAELEGFKAIGIEIDPTYVEIARRRIASDVPLFAQVATGLP